MCIRDRFAILLFQWSAFGQDYVPEVQEDSVQIDFDVVEYLWIGSSYYQFVALSVTGLPEINTMYNVDKPDTIDVTNLKSISSQDIFSGGFSFATIISKNQTFNPVKTIKVVVYDSISKTNKVKHTSLFLLDDFDKINKGETLIIYSRGCFGYQTQSYADCEDFVANLKFDKSLLISGFNSPIADRNWYQEWLKVAPKDYWSPRIANYFGEKHKYFEAYSQRIKNDPNKK